MLTKNGLNAEAYFVINSKPKNVKKIKVILLKTCQLILKLLF